MKGTEYEIQQNSLVNAKTLAWAMLSLSEPRECSEWMLVHHLASPKYATAKERRSKTYRCCEGPAVP